MAIANTPVATTRPDGRRVTVPLFEMLVRRLAAGKTSRRISPMPFIALVIACSGKDAVSSPMPEAAGAREPMDGRLVSASDADVEDAIADLLRMTRMAARRERP